MITLNMSSLQKNIWEMRKRYEGSSIGNIGGILNMEKEIDEKLVYDTICRVQYLNPALRLCVSENGSLYLSGANEVPFEVIDNENLSETEINENIRRLSNVSVYSKDSVLVRYYLIRRKEDSCLVGIYHHLLCDGIALQKVAQQLYELSHDAKHALWAESVKPDMRYIEELKEDKEKKTDKRVQKGIEWYASLYKPDYFVFPKRRGNALGTANVYQRKITGDLYEQMQSWQTDYALTTEQLYEAAFACHETAITGRNCISLGRIMANRRKSNIDIVGMYANTLPLFMDVDEEESFLSLCQRIKQTEFQMFRYSDVTIGDIREAISYSGKMYEISITYRSSKRLPREQNAIVKEIECDMVELPLRLMIDEQDDGIFLTYKYMRDVYSEKEIMELDKYLAKIIQLGMTGRNISELKDAARPERKPFKKQENICDMDNLDVAEQFWAYVRQYPKQMFLIDISQKNPQYITYQKAGEIVSKLVYQLQKIQQNDSKVKNQLIIGLQLHRTYRMPLAMLACLTSGNIFYPIAIEETTERIKEISAYTDEWLTDDIIDEWLKDCCDTAQRMEPLNYQKEDIAYIINTSGSTGQPKMVQIFRNALNKRLYWMIHTFQMNGCRVLQKTKNTFDVSIWELLLPAMCCGSLVMLPDKQEKIPESIYCAIIEQKIDKVHFVPSMLSVFLSWLELKNGEKELQECLTDVFVSGEALKSSLVDRFYRLLPNVNLHNLYGPAECTIDVTYHECRMGEKITPIGMPVWDTELKIVNEAGKEVPSGYIGEIVIAGELVGKGYYDNLEETKRRFFEAEKQRAYRTGDYGYVADNGEIVYAGRMDREIKLRGMRVNLTTVEQETASVSGIYNTAAIVEQNRLILFLEAAMSKEQIRESLGQRIAPHYMPDCIQILDKIPCTQNGKCDYQKLRQIYIDNQEKQFNQYHRTKRNSTKLLSQEQKIVISCVQKVLPITISSIDANLFDYGMDSLSVAELLIALERYGYSLRFEEIYATGTVRKIAELFQQKKDSIKRTSIRTYPGWQDLTWEKRGGEKRPSKVIIGVPYAGADENIFNPLASLLTSSGYQFWAYHAGDRHEPVECVARKAELQLRPFLCQTDMQIIILGCCVGSALAIETVRRLQKYTKAKIQLVLIGSLPTYYLKSSHRSAAKDGEAKLIWDVLPKTMGEQLLSILYGKKIHITKKMYQQLKEDAKKYVDYFETYKKTENRVIIDTMLIYGKQDYLTKGYRQKYLLWKRYLSGRIQVIGIAKAKHFCVSTHAEKIAELIRKL